MSTSSQPISLVAFAAALSSLPLSSIYGKAAEIRNSISHLQRSNSELSSFADGGDVDCVDAIRDNELVIERMRERMELVRIEVEEKRGMKWVDELPESAGETSKADAGRHSRNDGVTSPVGTVGNLQQQQGDHDLEIQSEDMASTRQSSSITAQNEGLDPSSSRHNRGNGDSGVYL